MQVSAYYYKSSWGHSTCDSEILKRKGFSANHLQIANGILLDLSSKINFLLKL